MKTRQREEMENLTKTLAKAIEKAGFLEPRVQVTMNARGEVIAKIILSEDHVPTSVKMSHAARLVNNYPIQAAIVGGIPFPKNSSIGEWV